MNTVFKRMIGTAAALAAIGVVYVASTKETPLKGIGAAISGKRGGGAGGGKGEGDFPTPVLVGEAKLADIPVFLEGVGTVKALNTVTVKSLVEGKILKFNFTEGQFVKKGAVLAEIDAAPYQAAFDQVVAKKQVDETLLATAIRDFERYGKVSTGVVAQKTVDTQEALVRQLRAQVAADAAAVTSAQTTLDYTKVVAPIDGRTGIRMTDAGNVTRTSDAGIVVLTQLQPITVLFTLPQQQLPQIAKAMAAGAVAADAMDGDNKISLDRGVVTVVDNQVDQTTGTIKLKAEFPNAALQLWPGQFVNLRVLADTLKQVTVLPTPAIQRGPTGIYVFVATADNKVTQRPVTIGLQSDTQSVVLTGVTAGERVVTTGFARLQDGGRIWISPSATGEAAKPAPSAAPGSGAPEASAAPAAAGERQKGEGKGGKRRDGEGKRPPASAEAKGAAPAAQGSPQ